ncbi:helix-turn-helix domain-containing protein [Mobiluncus mulieris]|uniref:helix-turn-helix domain-containing protein n=1 Tax=Mobiluncus mulieris TaxID=2052 RepID=UPI00242B8FC9|nr:helix-turn-helix domain-containing protein [Mobiluncus mulieris]
MSTVCAPNVKDKAAAPQELATVLRPGDDVAQMADFSKFLDSVPSEAALLAADGRTARIPREIYQLLAQAVKSLQSGQAVSVIPMSTSLTTQQAADLLGISRPTFIKILNRGDIKYERLSDSRHRRVLLSDVLDYARRCQVQRREILSDMVAEASPEEFDTTAEQVRQVLARERGKQ